MKEKLSLLSLGQRLSAIILLLYVISSSLFFEEKVGFISIIILGLFFLVNLGQENTYKISFFMALSLLALAVIIYFLDVTDTLAVPIRMLSEWSYLLIIVGALQMISFKKVS